MRFAAAARIGSPGFGLACLESASGQGFVTEASQAVLDEVATSGHCAWIYAITHPDNAASQRVLQKLNFSFDGTRALDPGAAPVTIFKREVAPRREPA